MDAGWRRCARSGRVAQGGVCGDDAADGRAARDLRPAAGVNPHRAVATLLPRPPPAGEHMINCDHFVLCLAITAWRRSQNVRDVQSVVMGHKTVSAFSIGVEQPT